MDRSVNETYIAQIFLEDEAEVIRSMPISPLPSKDQLIWRGTKNGIFFVRSAYFLEKDILASKEWGPSQPAGCLDWKECWSLKIPNVAKLFLWKAMHNLLPNKMNLINKGVVQNTLSPICELEDETVEHILWNCLSAHDVWGIGPIRLQKCGGVSGSFPDLFESMLTQCDT